MLIETLNTDDSRWMGVLRRLRHDFHHQPLYVQLEAERMNATAEAFLASDGDQVFFVPYLVRSCNYLYPELHESVSDAVSPYGFPGILLSDAGRNPAFASQGLEAFLRTLADRRVCAAFLRMNPILGEDFATLFPTNAFHDSSQTVVVDLETNETELWKQVRRAFHQAFKKGKALGFTARVVSLEDVLDSFVELYTQTMDRVNAKACYYFQRSYFAQLARLPGVHCCVIEYGSTVIAACVFLECDGIVNTHLGGTRTEFLANSPFTMVVFEAIRWAKSRGNRWLQLGGGVGGREDSVLHFKAGFSDKRIPFLTSRFVIDEGKYHKLVSLAANARNTSPVTILSSSFFPAYRS
jgi:CelD/BcsL family acetyltransferase involved in cellulose biosynthesis